MLIYSLGHLGFNEIYENDNEYIVFIRKNELLINNHNHAKVLKLDENIHIHFDKETYEVINYDKNIKFIDIEDKAEYISLGILVCFCEEFSHRLYNYLRKSKVSKDTEKIIDKLEESVLRWEIDYCLENRDFKKLEILSELLNNKNNK